MKIDRLSTLIAALIATTFGFVTKPATAANLTALTPTNTLFNFDSNNSSAATSVGVTAVRSLNFEG